MIFNDLLVPELALCVQKELRSAIPGAGQGRLVASQNFELNPFTSNDQV